MDGGAVEVACSARSAGAYALSLRAPGAREALPGSPFTVGFGHPLQGMAGQPLQGRAGQPFTVGAPVPGALWSMLPLMTCMLEH